MISEYIKGKVIFVGKTPKEDRSKVVTPNLPGWPRPLLFADISKADIKAAVDTINKDANAAVKTLYGECTLTEVITGKNTAKIFIDNNAYYYAMPEVTTKRSIKSICAITKPNGYPLKWSEHGFCIRVPGRGIDILKICYKE